MSKRENVFMTTLKCENCENTAVIIRRKSKKKKTGHIKDLWCYKCQETTKHVESYDE